MRNALWLAGAMTLAWLPAALTAQTPLEVSADATAHSFPSDEVIRAMLARYVAEGQVKGVIVGILEADGRKRFISAGLAGDGAGGIDPDSLFEIGSINKTFTATVLADMVRRGEVGLDDPVAKYLPESVKMPSRNGKQITLRQLAVHTSGLPRLPDGYTPPDVNNPYADYSEKDLYAFLGRYELDRDPGERALYSNLGAGLLGHALARAAGAADFQSLVASRVLIPLGMRATGYGPHSKLVTGHDRFGAATKHWTVGVLAGAGGLNASARDMLAFIDANVGPVTAPIDVSMRSAHRPVIIDAEKQMTSGLAWGIRQRAGRTILHHSGGTGGFRTFVAIEPAANRGVIVMGNTGGFTGADNIAIDLLFPAPVSPTTGTAR